jgi:hypothetical protein
VGVPGGINTGVMLVDARKLTRGYSLKRYWAEVTRIVGEGIYHSVHGKYYGSADMPCERSIRAAAQRARRSALGAARSARLCSRALSAAQTYLLRRALH